MTAPGVRPIAEIARDLGLRDGDFETYGRMKAKIAPQTSAGPDDHAADPGRLVLVTAMSPTPAGEGKTTVAIALAMGMRRIGKRSVLALRQPSLGPIFGLKGGAAGGGRATLEPCDDINLHFTGDIHAVAAAHNLLASLTDNALYWHERFDGAELDPLRIHWGRVLESEDRALRHCVIGLGGPGCGVPREERFDIAAASEVMAILALARDRSDLAARLGRVVVGSTHEGRPVMAADLGADGAMAVLLRDAILPNLVQTAEGGPALVHAGPFGNIAQGCSSRIATRLAMRLGDYAVTEAGFGFDLGGEKFLEIKCRDAGFWPRVAVVVASLRALAVHGIENLEKHLESIAAFGLTPVVALNAFASDAPGELSQVERTLASRGVACATCRGYERGGEGATDLARVVCQVAEATDRSPPAPRFLYALEAPFLEKARAIARAVYGARDVVLTPAAAADVARAEAMGASSVPVCFAKTHLALSDDPAEVGRPRDFTVVVREVRVSAGAGMLVAMTGALTTMPGLPRDPAARRMRLMPDGRVAGLGG